MNKQERIRLAYGSTLMDSGYTLWHDDKKRYKGYVVGGVEHESVCERDDCKSFSNLFDEYVNMLDATLTAEALGEIPVGALLGIGTWIDEGRIYFDVVEWMENEEEAHAKCKMRGEKAYFDILAQKSIYIKDEK